MAEHLRAALGRSRAWTSTTAAPALRASSPSPSTGAPPAVVAAAAATAGVNVSVSEAAAARLDMGGTRPDAVVRASPHYYNTEEELDRLVEVVAGLTPR